MKNFLPFLLALITLSSVEAKPKVTNSELDIRVGTYNVWSIPARKWRFKKGDITESRSWENNKKAVAELIVKLDCDLLGLQEVSIENYEDLAKLIKKVGGKKYGLWWQNIYPKDSKRITGNAILYNKKIFKLSDQNILYFSPTPTEISKGWDCKNHYRAAATTVVTHKKTGKKIFFIATHGPLKEVANTNAGRLLVEFDQTYNKAGLPTIIVGDMNARPGKALHNIMCEYFEDSFLVAKENCGTIGTYNGSGEVEKNFSAPHRRIDHIYVRSTDKGKITVKDYKVNRDKYIMPDGESHYPSDHNPVVVNLTIK